jgi:hypothetical protein
MGGLRPFSFTRANLEQMVENIRTHPSYQLDANGKPIGEVIPWDFNHASEQDPTAGNLPSAGAPSQGWTYDLEVRNNPIDGHAELWALTKFLEPARTYVRMKQYKWASVAAALNAVDPTTGQNIGAMVTSIALTNTPFVEGMETLVANKNGGKGGKPQGNQPQVELRREFYYAAKTPEEAIIDMRELFGLPETAGAAEVLQQIGIVTGWYQNGGAPLGTDPSYIVGSIRTILNLPTLTDDLTVLSEAGKSVQMLVQQQMAEAGLAYPNTAQSSDGTVPPAAAPVAASKSVKGKATMNENFLKILSSKLGIRESEEAVLSEIADLLSLRAGMKEVFKLERDSSGVLLGAAKDTANAKAKLHALAQALGVEDADKAVARVAEVMEASAKLKELMPELEGLRIEKAANEEAKAETEVDQAIAARRLSADLKPLLLHMRKNDRKTFDEKYKVTAAQIQTQPAQLPVHLSQQKITDLTSKVTVRGGEVVQLPNEGVVDLAQYSGPNPTARAKAYLSQTVPGWDKLTNDQQFIRAVELRKRSNVIDTSSSQAQV